MGLDFFWFSTGFLLGALVAANLVIFTVYRGYEREVKRIEALRRYVEQLKERTMGGE